MCLQLLPPFPNSITNSCFDLEKFKTALSKTIKTHANVSINTIKSSKSQVFVIKVFQSEKLIFQLFQ